MDGAIVAFQHQALPSHAKVQQHSSFHNPSRPNDTKAMNQGQELATYACCVAQSDRDTAGVDQAYNAEEV